MISPPSLSVRSGALWFLASLVIGSANDLLAKIVLDQGGLTPAGVAFWRLLIGLGYLLAFRWLEPKERCSQEAPVCLWVYALCGGGFSLATLLWHYGLVHASLSASTLISFMQPLCLLALSSIGLSEAPRARTSLAACLGFLGVLIMHYPYGNDGRGSGVLLLAIWLFSLLDLLMKKYAAQAPALTMLWYNTLFALLALLPVGYGAIGQCTWRQLPYLLGMGAGGNLLLFTLVKAYAQAPLRTLAPLRYLSLLLAMAIDQWGWNHSFVVTEWVGACCIIPAALFVLYEQEEGQEIATRPTPGGS